MTEAQKRYYCSQEKSIVAVNTDGTMAGCFDSIKVAHEKYHLTRHLIVRSCRTGSLYRGLRWMFEDEYRTAWLEGRTDELRYERPSWQKPMQRGDRVLTGASPSSLRSYCRALIRVYGEDVTLGDICKCIDIGMKKDNTNWLGIPQTDEINPCQSVKSVP